MQPTNPQSAPQPHRRDQSAPGRSRTILIVVVVAVVVILAAVVAAFVLLSPEKRAQREIETALQDLNTVKSYGDFADRICTELRPDAAVVDELNGMSEQYGVSFDQYFVEQIKQSFPASLEVTDVSLDGDDATVSVNSTDDEGTTHSETVQMRKEDGTWLVCDPAVGTGQIQPAGQ